MKILRLLLVIAFFSALVLIGCGGKDGIATERLEASFTSSEPGWKASVNKAITAIKSGDHAAALAELETLSGNPKITSEQREAVKDVITQVKRVLSDTAKEAVDEAGKSLDKVRNSLPK